MSEHDFWVEVKTGTELLENGKYKAILITEGKLITFEKEFNTKAQASKHARKRYKLWIRVMQAEAKKFGYEVSSHHEDVQ